MHYNPRTPSDAFSQPLALRSLGAVGRWGIHGAGELGRSSVFFASALAGIFQRPFRGHLLLELIHFIGNRSVGIVILTSAFTGMVLVLQGYTALVRFGGTAWLGPLVSLSLVRELGPVLGALMITARAGSAMAATLGTMRVTEQIDALDAMAIDSVQYLVSPRLLASLLTFPLLVALFDATGIFTAWLFGVTVLGIDGGTFWTSVQDAVQWDDLAAGFWKSLAFGAIMAWVSTYRGYNADHGALGVGRATTGAVVVISVTILAVDYALTALLFG